MASQEYYDFLHEFMCAVKQNYREKVLIQGTAPMVLAGLVAGFVASLKATGRTLVDPTFLFLGAGEEYKVSNCRRFREVALQSIPLLMLVGQRWSRSGFGRLSWRLLYGCLDVYYMAGLSYTWACQPPLPSAQGRD